MIGLDVYKLQGEPHVDQCIPDFELKVISSEVFLEALGNVFKKSEFKRCYASLKVKLSIPEFSRLESWVSFFNGHFPKACFMYESSLFVLFRLAENRTYIFDQTKHEQQLSFSFYNQLIKSNEALQLTSKTAHKMFYMSFLFSKYPGMLKASLHESFSFPSAFLCYVDFYDLFEKLFCKFDVPELLLENIEHLEKWEFEVLMELAKGRGLRAVLAPWHKVSKQEASVIMNKVFPNFQFDDHLILNSLVVARLIIAVRDVELIRSYITYSKLFKYSLDQFIEHFDKHVAVIRWMQKQDVFIVGQKIQLIDFIDCQDLSMYSIKGKSWGTVRAEILDWEGFEHVSFEDYKEVTWRKSVIEKFVYRERGEITYTIEEITTAIDLYEEGYSLRHCVFSYLDLCVENKSELYSMKRVNEGGMIIHHATIQVEGRSVIQFFGFLNSVPNSKAYEVLKRFCEKHSLHLLDE